MELQKPKSDMLGLIGAGVGAVGSLASNLLGNSSNRKQAREQRDWMERMWNQQNSYNHPSAQMGRFKEAGLNPNLIYGTGSASAGNADKVGSYDRANMEFNNPMDAFTDTRLKSAQTNNVETQNDNIIQDTALKGMQTAHEAGKAAKTTAERKTIDALRMHSVDAAAANVRLSQQNIVGKQIDNFVKSRTGNTQIKAAAQNLINSTLDQGLKQKENAIKAFQIGLQKQYGIPAAQSDILSNSLRAIMGTMNRATDVMAPYVDKIRKRYE